MAIEATDLFGLGANFSPQSSSTGTNEDRATALDEKGDLACESMVNERDELSTEYTYCGTDIRSDLGAFLTAFGNVVSGKIITGISIQFEAGSQPTVSVTGTDYPATSASINNADVSAAVPAAGGVTVPTLTGVTLGAAATPISLSVNLSLNHIPAVGSDGEVFTAENITFIAESECEYLGVPTTYDPVTDWTTDSTSESDSNSDHDRASWSGHRYFAAN